MTDSSRDPGEIVRRGYDRVSDLYRGDDERPAEYSEWLDQIMVCLRPGARVLDLGCGNGVPVARTLTDAGRRVTGIDVSDRQIERARRLVPTATFVRADMTGCDYGVSQFDAVVALYSLIHLPLNEQPAVIERGAAALVDGGVFLATVGWDDWTGLESGWLGAEGDMWWSQADHDTYRRWLEQAGLRVDQMEFIPEGNSGHALVWATRTGLPAQSTT
jgi:2-polyprenyl-3-methyl-5-hydroxy-6-metoxy-1,4-benzoquinol methylase